VTFDSVIFSEQDESRGGANVTRKHPIGFDLAEKAGFF
jgi:hypothetical protein